MKCVILQPSYIPWRGFFHQIQKSDIFVFYDDVQYDERGWRNRNRIKTSQGPQWLTIPVLSRGSRIDKTPIRDIRVCWDRPWAQKHWETIRHCYGKAPFFGRYAPLLESFYRRKDELLADFTIDFIQQLAAELGIGPRRFVRSSTLDAQGSKTDRLLWILGALKADHYISGPSAREYIDEDKVRSAGVTLEYMSYDYPEYEQLYPPYDAQITVLDLLFTKGPDAGRHIWPGAEGGEGSV